MRLPTTTALALALALTTGLVAGCGADEEEGKPIPRAAAQNLDARLAEVQRRFDFGGGACADIQDDTKPAVNQIIASLPSDVDTDLRNALQQSFDHLFELSEQECEEPQETETQTEAPPVTETIPTETETIPTETETVPTETETVPTQPTTPEQPTETEPGLPPGQGGQPPGQGGENPGQGGGGGAISPEGQG